MDENNCYREITMVSHWALTWYQGYYFAMLCSVEMPAFKFVLQGYDYLLLRGFDLHIIPRTRKKKIVHTILR